MTGGLRTAVAALTMLGAWSCRPPTAAAQEIPIERATLVDGAGDPLRGGGSRDPFTLELPQGAACPGDSADDDYRVNTYMIPASADPATVPYDGLGPSPRVHGQDDDVRQPLYDTSSAFVVSQLTEDAQEPGEPGRIVPLPMLDLAVFAPGDLPPGTYRVGVACTRFNEVEHVWDAQLRIVEDASDEPAGIRWEAIGVGSGDTGSGTGPAPFVLGGIALAGAASFVTYRRRRSPARTSAPREGTRW